MTQVLVGIITYAGNKHCREIFFKYLAAIKTPVAYAFVTNSGEEDARELEKLAEPLKKLGRTVAVMVQGELHEHPLDQIVANRNMLREYFLQGNWEYLYSLDADLIGPTNAIDVLLSHKKPLVTGWYLGAFERTPGKLSILPLAYAFDKPGHARQLAIKDVLIPRFIPVAAAGLGCCLIHKNILQKQGYERKNGTEDAPFFTNARENLGEKLWMDTRVAYWHLKVPITDERAKLYDPRRYTLKK